MSRLRAPADRRYLSTPGTPLRERLRRAAIGLAFLAGLLLAVFGGEPIAVALYLPYAAMGTLLLIRRPENPIGGLLVVVGWGLCLGSLRVTAEQALLDRTATLTDALVASVAGWGWGIALPAFVALAFLFPTGRLPSGRIRRRAILAVVAAATVTVVIAVHPNVNVIVAGRAIDVPNVLGLLPDATLWMFVPSTIVLWSVLLVIVAIAVGWTVVRYRRTTGLERVQLRWLVAALAVVTISTAIWAVLVVGVGGAASIIGWISVALGYPAVPVAIGVAVLRYRLYEIDRVISRTISWAVVTGSVVVLFAVLVLGLQSILAPITEGNGVAVATSTFVVFAVFQPLRRRIQRAVDRRFNRTRADSERVAARFAAQLRDETDLERISDHLLGAVELAVAPAGGALWVRMPVAPRRRNDPGMMDREDDAMSHAMSHRPMAPERPEGA